MRIAIEANVLTSQPQTGIARYTRQLSRAIDELNQPGRELIETELLYRWPRFRFRKMIDETRTQRRSLRIGDVWPRQSRFDCALCTFRKTLNWPEVPIVATVYDLYQELGLGYGTDEDRIFLEERRLLLNSATRIICISDATRKDLIYFYPDTASRAVTVHLGVDDRFKPQAANTVETLKHRYSLHRPFVLFMGLNSPNKNLSRLLAAYQASSIRKSFDLVVAGPAGAMVHDQVRPVNQNGARIRLIGFVDDNDLPALYAAASAFVMPSLHEGFGLPILEAMRCGTPVLAGNRGASPEVAAGFATLVDPLDVESIASGMESVVCTPIETLDAARSYAAGMSWSVTAERTIRVVREAIGDF